MSNEETLSTSSLKMLSVFEVRHDMNLWHSSFPKILLNKIQEELNSLYRTARLNVVATGHMWYLHFNFNQLKLNTIKTLVLGDTSHTSNGH